MQLYMYADVLLLRWREGHRRLCGRAAVFLSNWCRRNTRFIIIRRPAPPCRIIISRHGLVFICLFFGANEMLKLPVAFLCSKTTARALAARAPDCTAARTRMLAAHLFKSHYRKHTQNTRLRRSTACRCQKIMSQQLHFVTSDSEGYSLALSYRPLSFNVSVPINLKFIRLKAFLIFEQLKFSN